MDPRALIKRQLALATEGGGESGEEDESGGTSPSSSASSSSSGGNADAGQQEGYVLYILSSQNRNQKAAYVGITNNLERRVRQHNGIVDSSAHCFLNDLSKKNHVLHRRVAESSKRPSLGGDDPEATPPSPGGDVTRRNNVEYDACKPKAIATTKNDAPVSPPQIWPLKIFAPPLPTNGESDLS